MAGRREKLRRVGIIPEYRGFTPMAWPAVMPST